MVGLGWRRGGRSRLRGSRRGWSLCCRLGLNELWKGGSIGVGTGIRGGCQRKKALGYSLIGLHCYEGYIGGEMVDVAVAVKG